MTRLDLDSEPYQARGNMAADGAEKVLGTPTLDRLRVLIRETVQNSFDAWDKERCPRPRYSFHMRTLDSNQRRNLSSSLLRELPDNDGDRTLFEAMLSREELWCYEISDSGTTGLGGPVRADASRTEGEDPDFVDFMRNMGSPRDKTCGGGTYGYGKSSLFLASQCRTILVYSKCRTNGGVDDRFMGFHLGRSYFTDSTRYTGRHWWGRMAVDGIADPVTGGAAVDAARLIGIPNRDSSATGTSIVVLDPHLDGKSAKQVVNTVHETLLWYFWPKMMENGARGPFMEFQIELDGEPIKMLHPVEFPPLDAYVSAMKTFRSEETDNICVDIKCHRPKQKLGRLSISRVLRKKRVFLDTGDDDSLVPERSHHVALMRPAELVVKYQVGPEIADEKIEYGASFVCDKEVERAFALAEPPAHDDWIYANMPKGSQEKTFVRVALKRIDESLKEQIIPAPDQPGGDVAITPLGAAADRLGMLLATEDGPRLTPRPTASPKPGKGSIAKSRNPRILGLKNAGLTMLDGQVVARFNFVLEHGNTAKGTHLIAVPEVLLAGGSSTSTPVGVDPPRIVEWILPSGDLVKGQSELGVHSRTSGEMQVSVSVPRDSAVTVRIDAQAME